MYPELKEKYFYIFGGCTHGRSTDYTCGHYEPRLYCLTKQQCDKKIMDSKYKKVNKCMQKVE